MNKIYRAMINQPSTLQPHHRLHGIYCTIVDGEGANVTAYFAEGVVHSMILPRNSIDRIYLSDAEEKYR